MRNSTNYLHIGLIIAMLIGWGAVYGALSTKVDKHEAKISELEPIAAQLSSLVQSNQDIKQDIRDIKQDIRDLRQRNSVLPSQGR